MWKILFMCTSAFFQFTYSHKCETRNSSNVYRSVSVTCENITDLVPEVEKAVSIFECLDCNVPILDDKTFLINFRGITFNMSNSHVKKIKDGMFTTFTNKTRSFIFQNNEIDYIQPKLFNIFNDIDQINFRNNKISSVETGVFEDTTLFTLDMSLNHLTNVSIFDGLKVNKLNLSNNAIKELPAGSFDKVIFWRGKLNNILLQELDLSRNFIEKLTTNTFKSKSADSEIAKLNLDMNYISKIENNAFLKLNKLLILYLQNNRISELYKDSFKGLTGLVTLRLQNNLISNIPNGLFKDLVRLDLLDLSKNQLASFSPYVFSGLKLLTILNVSHNHLKVLNDSHLLPLGRMYSLDVSDNLLYDFNLEKIMEHQFRLRMLTLNNNFWTCKDLVQMYRLMNLKSGGLGYPARHFDVPNLHGIACSLVKLKSYDNLSFEDFLNVISQDKVFEDIFGTGNNHNQQLNDLNSLTSNIKIVKYSFAILTLIIIIVFIYNSFKYVILYLRSQNYIKKTTFAFVCDQN